MERPDDTTVFKKLQDLSANLLASASKSKSSLASLSKSPPSSGLSPYQAVITDEIELIPSSLSGSLSDHLLPHQTVTTDEVEHTPSSFSPFQPGLLDSTSLASTCVAHKLSASVSRSYRADDRFIGSHNLEPYLTSTLNIQQLRPQGLYLFDLAVLADAVHNHEPLYSYLKHQCFWFASMICDVVAKEYICTTVASKANPVSIDEPCNNYLPDLVGRWKGIKINNVEEDESSIVASKFQNYLKEKKNEIKTRWSEFHPESQQTLLADKQALQARVSRLERMLRDNNVDPDAQ